MNMCLEGLVSTLAPRKNKDRLGPLAWSLWTVICPSAYQGGRSGKVLGLDTNTVIGSEPQSMCKEYREYIKAKKAKKIHSASN